MLSRLNVGTKLLIGFGIVVGLSVALGVMAMYFMKAVSYDANHLANASAKMIQRANVVERDAQNTLFAARGYRFTGEESYMQQVRASLSNLEQALNQSHHPTTH